MLATLGGGAGNIFVMARRSHLICVQRIFATTIVSLLRSMTLNKFISEFPQARSSIHSRNQLHLSKSRHEFTTTAAATMPPTIFSLCVKFTWLRSFSSFILSYSRFQFVHLHMRMRFTTPDICAQRAVIVAVLILESYLCFLAVVVVCAVCSFIGRNGNFVICNLILGREPFYDAVPLLSMPHAPPHPAVFTSNCREIFSNNTFLI